MSIPKLCRLALLVLAGSLLSARAETIVALTSDSRLRHFSSTTPGAWIRTIDITGIPAGQSPVALDFRPDGSLVVFTREGTSLRPFTVDPNTGATVNPGITINTASATSVAFDAFSRDAHSNDLVLATDDDTLRRFFFSSTGSTSIASKTFIYDNSSTDGDPVDVHVNANPSIVAMASTNAFKGAQAAVLYGVDSTQNSLVKIDWETGTADTVATLRNTSGVTIGIEFRTGFDISGTTGIAYIGQGTGTISASLRTVDLTTGIVTNAGTIGPDDQAGVNVVDISVPPPTDVVNISTRARVGTGEDVMIAGFIAQGGATTRLIIRGIGPSLTGAGVNGALSDPVLTVFNASGVEIATNDNWRTNQQAEISQTGIAPSNDLEAAFVSVFPPGQYTAIVSGKDGGAGVGLVEIYRLPDL